VSYHSLPLLERIGTSTIGYLRIKKYKTSIKSNDLYCLNVHIKQSFN